MSFLGEEIRRHKNEYFTLIKGDHLDQADNVLLSELEESIFKLSMDYARLGDETLPIVELPIDTIKEIFDVMAVIDPENYVLVINASGKKVDAETLKKQRKLSRYLRVVANRKVGIYLKSTGK